MNKSLQIGLIFVLVSGGLAAEDTISAEDWPNYGRDKGGTRYSPLDQIDTGNVAQLEVAWIYRTGDLDLSPAYSEKAAFESTPIVVDGVMYLTTPRSRVIALDPATGTEKWTYDPGVNVDTRFSEFTNRGVSTWIDSEKQPGDPGYRRLYVGTLDARLICVDAATGQLCAGFGENGVVDLKRTVRIYGRSDYQVTSPPAVIGDIVVTGSSIGDNRSAQLEAGVVRAYDARTGRELWDWDPVPRSDDAPHADTWQGEHVRRNGAANVWSIISADPERDLIFLPTSSASPDHFGGERLGQNLYANSLVALRASTGEVVWHFQAVHHDVWDYDLPSQPVLTDLRKDGESIPVVVQGTKMGHVFVLHRETGEPVLPIEEQPVPQTDVPGEETWPTQPFPVRPPPLLTDLDRPLEPWGPTDDMRAWAAEKLAAYRYEGRFTPPSLQGTIQFPSTAGGINWGGVTVDPERGILVTNMNRIAHIVRLIPRDVFPGERQKGGQLRGEMAPQAGTAYGMERTVFLLPSGMPATPPPWGLAAGVDLAKGEVLWKRPLGFLADPNFIPDARDWGSPMLGGAITTKGGLVFVGATMDNRLRALNTVTGEELWSAELPAGGQATPMTYAINGKQYVVICAGGHGKLGTKMGDHVVAFALP